MIRYILARTGQAMLSMLAVTIFVFGIVRMSGDPLQVLLPVEASRQQYEEMRRLLYNAAMAASRSSTASRLGEVWSVPKTSMARAWEDWTFQVS